MLTVFLVWAFCAINVYLLWPVFAENDRQSRIVWPLTQDELASQGLYRLTDKAKCARMRSMRNYSQHLWDLNRQHAEAIKVWRLRNFGRTN